MALVYVAEYAGLMPSPSTGSGQIPLEPPIAEYTVAVGAEAKSPVFNAKTRLVRIHTDAVCSILIGANPTAAATNQRLAANQTEFKGVPNNTGVGYRLSVISNT